MKRKLFIASSISLMGIFIIFAISKAFTYTTVDGVWGKIDPGGPESGTIIDMIGVEGNVGIGPGGADTTYRRLTTVCAPDPDGDDTFSEWEPPLETFDTTNLGEFVNGCTTGSSLFISEYVYNQRNYAEDQLAIEIYNPTPQQISMASYTLRVWTGNTSYITEELSGTIEPFGTYVAVTQNLADGITGEKWQFINVDSNNFRTAALIMGGFISDADNSFWASGPSADIEDPTIFSGTYNIWETYVDSNQNIRTDDWNQVRYGGSTDDDSSGLAFKGVQTPGSVNYKVEEPFPLGKFCHINQPLNGVTNSLSSTTITLTMSGIQCPGDPVEPLPPTEIAFLYDIIMDETYNDMFTDAYPTGCPYGDTPPCADAVFASRGDNQTFTCHYDGDIQKIYMVAIIGWMPLPSAADSCDEVTFITEQAQGAFFSDEDATNCGCLFAFITENEITSVDLVSFSAEGSETGISVMWETSNELNNIGFNLYRADSLVAERVLLNESLILTLVPPGSPYGAVYTYEDPTVTYLQNYFYWLETIDTNGESHLYGPVSAVRK